jgi:hypothetical protein
MTAHSRSGPRGSPTPPSAGISDAPPPSRARGRPANAPWAQSKAASGRPHPPQKRRRAAAQSGSEHYRQEAGLIERALATETDPFLAARYKFYLAQTHLDAGDKEKALAAYRERAALGFWDQEVFISLYRSAGIEADLGFDEDAVIASYLLAHEARRDRRGAAWSGPLLPAQGALPAGVRSREAASLSGVPTTPSSRKIWIYKYGLLDEYDIERPSIVVAVAGKREQSLRFDPFSAGSHYHIRPSLRGRQIPLWVDEGQKPLDVALKFFEKPLRPADCWHRPRKTMWRRR